MSEQPYVTACGALSEQEARDAVKWDVIVTIAAAFGMSRVALTPGWHIVHMGHTGCHQLVF